jgi:hypothetical protein
VALGADFSAANPSQFRARPSAAPDAVDLPGQHTKPAADPTFLRREDLSVERIEGILRDKMCVA